MIRKITNKNSLMLFITPSGFSIPITEGGNLGGSVKSIRNRIDVLNEIPHYEKSDFLQMQDLVEEAVLTLILSAILISKVGHAYEVPKKVWLMLFPNVII